MGSTNRSNEQEDRSIDVSQKLMVSGFVCPQNSCTLAFEIRRGMPIHSKEGLEVGSVAAIVLDDENRLATHLLLSQLPERRGYWLVPVDSIEVVQVDSIRLRIPATAVDGLPFWQSSE